MQLFRKRAKKLKKMTKRAKCSQTCSNYQLCKSTTHLRQPILSPTKQITIQLLLHKTTSCAARPMIIFLSHKLKKLLFIVYKNWAIYKII